MPFSYHIDTQRNAIFLRAWGVITSTELDRGVRAMLADPSFSQEYARLNDWREATQLAFGTAAVRATAESMRPLLPVRRAWVAATDEAFGVMRMFQATTGEGGEQGLVCRDLAEGMAWIGLDAGTPWPDHAPDFTTEPPQPRPRRDSPHGGLRRSAVPV